MRNRIWCLELEADTVRRLDPTIYARYAQKLFPYWDSTIDLARDRPRCDKRCPLPPRGADQGARLLTELVQELPLPEATIRGGVKPGARWPAVPAGSA